MLAQTNKVQIKENSTQWTIVRVGERTENMHVQFQMELFHPAQHDQFCLSNNQSLPELSHEICSDISQFWYFTPHRTVDANIKLLKLFKKVNEKKRMPVTDRWRKETRRKPVCSYRVHAIFSQAKRLSQFAEKLAWVRNMNCFSETWNGCLVWQIYEGSNII